MSGSERFTIITAWTNSIAEQQEPRGALGPRYADGDLVFCQRDGKPLHGHNLNRRDLRRLLKNAGLPRIRFHDLRHSHASHLLHQGVNPKVSKSGLGTAPPPSP